MRTALPSGRTGMATGCADILQRCVRNEFRNRTRAVIEVLADLPTGNLDSKTGGLAYERLAAMADRVLHLQDGRIGA